MTNKTFAELVLFGTTFIWGSTFVVIKWGLTDLPPLEFLAVRFTMAAALFGLLAAPALRRIPWATVKAGGGLGLLLVLGFALQTVGLGTTTASKSAFITGLMVIFTPLLQAVMSARRPTAANLAGVAVVTLGLWLLTHPAASGSGLVVGDALTLLCAVVFAGYIVHLDRCAPLHAVAPLTFLQILTAAILSWLGAGLFETERLIRTLSPTALWTTGYLAIAATVLTGYLMTRYQRDTTPTRAAIIYTVEPVWAALLAAFALDERLGPAGLAGAGLILLGVLLSELSDLRLPAFMRR